MYVLSIKKENMHSVFIKLTEKSSDKFLPLKQFQRERAKLIYLLIQLKSIIRNNTYLLFRCNKFENKFIKAQWKWVFLFIKVLFVATH